MTTRFVLTLVGAFVVAFGGGVGLAQMAPDKVSQKAAAHVAAQTELTLQEHGQVEAASEEDTSGRAKFCNTTCKLVDAQPEYTEVCEPYIASFEPEPGIPSASKATLAPSVKQSIAAKLSRIYRVPDRITPLSVLRKRSNGRLEIISSVRQCGSPPTLKSLIVRGRSPKCWINEAAFCRYNPSGKTGYPCSCGGQPGFFG